MQPVAKIRVLEALRDRIALQRAALAESQRSTQAGATHAEAKPEHAKDTRAVEASYLARGLALRVEELDRAAALLESFEPRDFGEDEPVAVGALVGLEGETGALRIAFLSPAAGGERVEVDGREIYAVTPGSPLGRALLGREVDDEVTVRRAGGRTTRTIAWVR
ncbi:MAG: GreA/GreB family elongation factor [Myxococcota bacterium]